MGDPEDTGIIKQTQTNQYKHDFICMRYRGRKSATRFREEQHELKIPVMFYEMKCTGMEGGDSSTALSMYLN